MVEEKAAVTVKPLKREKLSLLCSKTTGICSQGKSALKAPLLEVKIHLKEGEAERWMPLNRAVPAHNVLRIILEGTRRPMCSRGFRLCLRLAGELGSAIQVLALYT